MKKNYRVVVGMMCLTIGMCACSYTSWANALVALPMLSVAALCLVPDLHKEVKAQIKVLFKKETRSYRKAA